MVHKALRVLLGQMVKTGLKVLLGLKAWLALPVLPVLLVPLVLRE